jgi:hypothetical protein
MQSISLNGVTFRWDQDRLIVTVQGDQRILSGSDAAQLLDFLLSNEQVIYAAEQARELPGWVRPGEQFSNGQVIGTVQPRQLPAGWHRLSPGGEETER